MLKVSGTAKQLILDWLPEFIQNEVADISEYDAISNKFTCVGVNNNLSFTRGLVEALFSAVGRGPELPAEEIFQLVFLNRGPFGLNGHKLSGWFSLG